MADDYKITIILEGENKLSQSVKIASSDLQRFSNETRNASNQTQQFERQTQSMTDTLRQFAGGVLGGLALREVVNFAESMNELGTEVNANRILFEQLTRTLGGGTAVLRDLRAATGDVVDDMTLMAGANQLLRLGITETSDQTADLIGMIQRLKQPTESTTDAIQNFALMLSNESLLRLDSFGISSANVKRRMDELGQSFREATMAEMAGQIERLGDAADVAITPLARIQTEIDNIRQQLGAGLSTSLNSLGGFLIAMIEHGDVAWANITQNPYLNQSERDMVARMTSARRQIAPGSNQFPWYDMYNAEQQLLNGSVQVVSNDLAEATVRWMRPYTALVTTAADEWERIRDAVFQAAHTRMMNEAMITIFRQNMGGQDIRDYFDPLNYSGQLKDLQSQLGGTIGGIQVFSPDAAARARELADTLQGLVDQSAQFSGYIESGILSQAQVDRMRELADAATDFADQAEKGAKALHDASLTTLLGQGGGARSFMDLGRLSLASISDTGISEDALAALTDAVQIATGEQTANSLALRDDILPLLNDIYSQQGQDAYIQALQGLSAAIQNSWAGGEPLTPERMMQSIGWMYQPGSTGGETLTVGMGDTPWDIRQRTGMSYEEIMAATGWGGLGYYNLRPGTYQIGGGEVMRTGAIGDVLNGITTAIDGIGSIADVALDPMVTASESVVGAIDEVKSILDDITGSVHKVTIDLDVRIPAIIEWLFNQSGTDWMKNIITANGGVPPGSDTRGAGGGGSLR